MRTPLQTLAVIGCGRSGTTFVSSELTKCGLDVPHESRRGQHGIVSWYLTPTVQPGDYDLIVHLVRNPLTCISSMQTANAGSWRFIAKWLPLTGDLLHNCALYWHAWNKMAQAKADMTVQIEKARFWLPVVCERLGVRYTYRSSPTNLNTRRHAYQSRTWDDIKDTSLREECQALAKEYGYCDAP
jgi:hypothetical protein